jgi:hypothetical protein
MVGAEGMRLMSAQRSKRSLSVCDGSCQASAFTSRTRFKSVVVPLRLCPLPLLLFHPQGVRLVRVRRGRCAAAPAARTAATSARPAALGRLPGQPAQGDEMRYEIYEIYMICMIYIDI